MKMYTEMSFKEYLFEKMYDLKEESLITISSVVHKDQGDIFLKMLANAYEADCEHACKIADELGLSQKHFDAILENFEGMKKLYNEERSEYEVERDLCRQEDEEALRDLF